ncbi:hypothetical protein B296_00031850 [Ensete ventricosum]|uniref:Uncharacterized protein n=1 Tax=Ensete ventricosum TaxID=4639 RepID=A0A426YMR5_ENSVE|nr:hypothetical protein B296_00031850 [Ensete ventricosum]
MAGEGTPQGIATGRCRAAEHREETDLDGAMVAVMVGETEGAEGAVGAVDAVHVALALVRVGVDRALNEEPRRQKRPQPRRPATVLLRHSTALPPFPVSKEACTGAGNKRREGETLYVDTAVRTVNVSMSHTTTLFFAAKAPMGSGFFGNDDDDDHEINDTDGWVNGHWSTKLASEERNSVRLIRRGNQKQQLTSASASYGSMDMMKRPFQPRKGRR